MLQVINTVINKDARFVFENYTYDIHYVISNNDVLSIQCTVSHKTEEMFEPIGYIRKENGRVNSDFVERFSMTAHTNTFEAIVAEIEAEVKPPAKK